MFNIFADSLFNPKGLVKYVNKKGIFVFFYLFVMAIFLSAGAFVTFFAPNNSIITEETTGCRLVNQSVMCDGDNYSVDKTFYMYGFEVHLLDEFTEVSDVTTLSETTIIIKDDYMKIFVGSTEISSLNIFSNQYGVTNLSEGIKIIQTSILIASVTVSILSNLALILVIALFSSITFLRFKKQIQYRKLFKLVVYAITPVVVLFTIYNLLQFSDIIFFILMFISYRSVFTLQRELQYQMAIRQAKAEQPDEVVETHNFDDIDKEDVDDSDKEDQ